MCLRTPMTVFLSHTATAIMAQPTLPVNPGMAHNAGINFFTNIPVKHF